MRSLVACGASSLLLAGARAFVASPSTGFARTSLARRVCRGSGCAVPPGALRASPRTRMKASSAAESIPDEQKTAEKEEKPTGHQPSSAQKMSPEQEALAARIQEHQADAARLTHTEEVRNLMEYSTGFGVLSTNSKAFEGYPGGSVVGFSLDGKGRPLFAFSSMSSHTHDLTEDSRVSLTVTAANFKGAADGRVSLIGDVNKVPEEDLADVREMYKKKHPTAYWVDFGDFSLMRMDSIRSMRFVGGFAMAGSVKPEDYMETTPDAVAEFSTPILTHMNDDHPETTKAMIEHYITGGVEVTSAKITAVDRLGMYVLVGMNDGQSGKLRLPFPRPAESRKDVKNLIVEMTNAAMSSADK